MLVVEQEEVVQVPAHLACRVQAGVQVELLALGNGGKMLGTMDRWMSRATVSSPSMRSFCAAVFRSRASLWTMNTNSPMPTALTRIMGTMTCRTSATASSNGRAMSRLRPMSRTR